jgi:hypothetical protein
MISKLGIDATKPPTRTPIAREFFKRSAPMGLEKILLENYLL